MINRSQALSFIVRNYYNWPSKVENYIGNNLFHGFRFIETLEGDIVFGNCIDPGITKKEFDFYKLNVYNNILQ